VADPVGFDREVCGEAFSPLIDELLAVTTTSAGVP
jgi:hypothetical protein